jgi:hypothetical protein
MLLVSVSVAGCSMIINPFKNRNEEYIHSRENASLKIDKKFNAKHKSDRYTIAGGDTECGMVDESLTVPPL